MCVCGVLARKRERDREKVIFVHSLLVVILKRLEKQRLACVYTTLSFSVFHYYVATCSFAFFFILSQLHQQITHHVILN